MNRRLSVSSWSVHGTLGNLPITGPTDLPNRATPSGAMRLAELPHTIAKHGINTLEICHFHLTSTHDDDLEEIRAALVAANVELWSLLVDGGDVNGADAARDAAWIEGWIPIAAKLGARNVRVIAGQNALSPQTLTASVVALKRLADAATANGMRLMTENWFDTLDTPDAVQRLFAQLEGRIDLCLDFGNWDGHSDKYADLASIARYATSCHARANFHSPTELDEEDFRRCLQLTVDADFHGPFTLIPAGNKGDEWQSLAEAARVAREFCEMPTP